VTIAGYNEWNSVVDNNREKSVSAQVTFTRADVVASMPYFGDIERPQGAPEGRTWRHLFDEHVTWQATPTFALLAHANGGFEPNAFGVSAWAAGALSARVRLILQPFFAARGDPSMSAYPKRRRPRGSDLLAGALGRRGIATLDYRSHARVSFRLDYRHDHAGADMCLGGALVGDGGAAPFVMNRALQDTVTLGATAWF
jgi:hypothetical protein